MDGVARREPEEDQPGERRRQDRRRDDEDQPAKPDADKEDDGRDRKEERKEDRDEKQDQGKGEKGGDQKGEDDGKKDEKPPTPRWKKLLYLFIGALIFGILVAAGTLYWLHARHFESTDDAFVDGYVSQVSSQVAGRVLQLTVTDNQRVEAGQLLLALDPRDYEVRLEQARAQLGTAAAQVEQARAELAIQRATLEQQQAQVRVAEADLSQAQQDLARFRAVNPAAITRQQLDQASSTTRAASARLDAARQAVAGARAQIDAQATRIAAAEATQREAEAGVHNAELQLSYTRVVAPRAGRVTRRTVNLGNFVNPGQALLAVVADEMWITANFKETQLTDMRAGQPVRITVDAFPDRRLHGHVESFQRGTGAVFSALPAENATGNYVKVVQRVPVRILFDGDSWREMPLAPGLSVSPRVTVR